MTIMETVEEISLGLLFARLSGEKFIYVDDLNRNHVRIFCKYKKYKLVKRYGEYYIEI